jgi:hypothetical protein
MEINIGKSTIHKGLPKSLELSLHNVFSFSTRVSSVPRIPTEDKCT